MKNKQDRKVRFVKCPKCARILPEPEQVPLYTCGGCDTILQAKYYRSQREASVAVLPTEDVQRNGNVHDSVVVQSSGEQSPIHNGDSNEKAVDDCNSEGIGEGFCPHPTSLTEEDTGLNIKEDTFIVRNKEAESLSVEIETREHRCGEDQYGDIVLENQDRQIENLNHAYKISTGRELEVLGNGKPQQHAMINEATHDGSDEGDQHEDIPLDKQNGGYRMSTKEFQPIMQPGTLNVNQLVSDNVAEVCRVSGNEIKCAEDKVVGVAKLGKEEKSVMERKSFIERIRGKLIGVTLKEVQHGNENSVIGDGAILGACATLSTSDVFQDTDYDRSLLDTVNGTLMQKTENLDDCTVNKSGKNRSVDEAGTSASLDTQNHDLLQGDPQSPNKRSSAYDGIFSSSDGNDHQAFGQPEHLDHEMSTEREHEAEEEEKNKGEECKDGAVDKQKEVGHGNSAEEATMASQYQPDELPMPFRPDNVQEVVRFSGNEINCLAEDMPVGVAKLGEEQKGIIERIHEKLGSATSSNEAVMSTDEVQNENENSLPDVIASSEAANERIASEVPLEPNGKATTSDNVEETWRQNIENLDDSDFSESERNRPTNNHAETLESYERDETVGNLLREVQGSPTKRSPAYDGSVSSYDGNNDNIHRPSKPLNEGTLLGAEYNSEWVSASSVRTHYGNSRSQARMKSSSYQLPDEKLTRRLRDGLLSPTIPIHRISSDMAFETGSSSSYVHDGLPSYWTHRKPHDRMGYMEGRRFSEDSWKENEFLPMYYDDEISGDYHRYSSDRRRQSDSLFRSSHLPRTHYSGGMYDGDYRIQDPYIKRHTDARRWSTQLPSGPSGYYHRGPMTYMSPLPYDPYPVNPYGWPHDTVYHSDDRRPKEGITRGSYLREKHQNQTVKRCLRPMAGGAPFITCHFCFTVVQLPEEFLLPKGKRIHRVKCGACSNVLEFSLENNSCLAPRLPYASETNPDRNMMSESHSRDSILVSEEARNSSEALGIEKSSSRTEEKQAKVTWELPARSKSPLHWLMGYSSPRDMFTDDDKD